MSILYLMEPALEARLKDGQILVKKRDTSTVLKTLPLEKVESIVALSSCYISHRLMMHCLEKGMPMTWVNHYGRSFGRLESTQFVNVERHALQFECYNDSTFRVGLSQRIVEAKLLNTKTLLGRWRRERNLGNDDALVRESEEGIKSLALKTLEAKSIESLRGLEGNGAKLYFKALGLILKPYDGFFFDRRSKQPPLDPFNAVLSLGYTLLMYEVQNAINMKGLHAYCGVLHELRHGHPALASDLMEEWRAPIIDAISLALVSQRRLNAVEGLHFQEANPETGAVYLNHEGSSRLVEAFERKVRSVNNYSTVVDYPLSYRESIVAQIGSYCKAIEHCDYTFYQPIRIK